MLSKTCLAEPAKLRADPTIQANEGERVLIVLSAGVFGGRSVLNGAGAIENGVKVLNLVAEPAKLWAGPTIQANEGERSVLKAQPGVTPSGVGVKNEGERVRIERVFS